MLGGNPTNVGTPTSIDALDDKIDDVDDVVDDSEDKIDAVQAALDHATHGLAALQVQIDDIQDKVDGTDAVPAALKRAAGRKQIAIHDGVVAAANAGSVLLMTATDGAILVKSVTIHAVSAQTENMTSCAVEGGASEVIEFISAANAVQASLDAEDKQVTSGPISIYLPVGGTIKTDLQGTGSAAVDLAFIVEYEAVEDGAYFVWAS